MAADPFTGTAQEQAPPAAPPEAPAQPVTFMIGASEYQTHGITKAQMVRTFELVPQVTRAKGKDYARGLLAEMLGMDPAQVSRNLLTEAQAEVFIAKLEAVAGTA